MFLTTHLTAFPSTDTTSNPTKPSSIKIVSPALTSLANPAYVTEHLVVSPITSSAPAYIVNSVPAVNSTLLGSNFPVLISGPLVSNNIATSLPNFLIFLLL